MASLHRPVRVASALLLAWALTSFVACGGQLSGATEGTEAGIDAGPDAPHVDAAPDVSLPHPPKEHRPAAIRCATPPLPPEPDPSKTTFGPGAKFECKVHADCTAQPNGRCVVVETNPPYDPGGTRCVYSTCNVDGDCGTKGVCQCGSVANTCAGGNCRVDADCASGYCSPSYGACLHELQGYFCHGPADACIDDGDCDATHFLTHCEVDATSAAWVCPPVMCGA